MLCQPRAVTRVVTTEGRAEGPKDISLPKERYKLLRSGDRLAGAGGVGAKVAKAWVVGAGACIV